MTLRGEWSRRAIAAGSTLALTIVAAFAGPSPARADECANATFRTGPSAGLPDCRAFEQVTPVDKYGAEPLDLLLPSSVSSGAVSFRTIGALESSQAVSLFPPYVATRGADGWSTVGVEVPQIAADTLDDPSTAPFISADTRRALVFSAAGLTPGATDGGSNLYLQTLAGGQRRLSLIATKSSRALYLDRQSVRVLGATPDYSSVVFASPYDLTNDSDDRGASRLYRFANGVLEPLATNVEPVPFGPDGTVRPVSSDGTRLTFSAGDAVYQTTGATARIVSHAPGRPTTPANGSSPIASSDGASVVFASTQALTAGSRAGSASLYRWTDGSIVDLLAQARTRVDGDLVPITHPLSGLTVRSVSADGASVWFTSSAQVLPNGPADGGLYLLDTPTGEVVLVASIAPGADPQFRFSAGGDVAAIVNRQGDAGDLRPCENPDGCGDQLFTASRGAAADGVYANFTCLTCSRSPSGAVGLGTEASASAFDDGRIIFSSTARLDRARDVNDRADVYEYDPATSTFDRPARLLSGGRGGDRTLLNGASADGRDVYITTLDSLVGADTDAFFDVYDVRVGGGLAGQQQPPVAAQPCTGDACKPAAAAPAALSGPAASSGAVRQPPASPPAFVVATPSRAARRTLARTGRIGLRVRVGAAGTISSRLQATIGARRRTVGSRTVKVAGARTVTVALRLSRAARRQLTRKGTLTFTLTVAYSERTEQVRKTLRLTSPNRKGDGR